MKKLITALALATCLTLPAHAQSSTMVRPGDNAISEDGKILKFNGMMTDENSKVLAKKIASKKFTELHIHSSGGQMSATLNLEDVISETDMKIVVNKGDYCLSACAMTFVAFKNQELNGILGFHHPYIPDANKDMVSHKGSAMAGINTLRYFMAFGFRPSFIHSLYTMTDPKNFLVYVDLEELNKFKIPEGLSHDDRWAYHDIKGRKAIMERIISGARIEYLKRKMKEE